MSDGKSLFGLILPLAVFGGWAAGALTARYTVRKEIDRLLALGGLPAQAPPPPQAKAEAPVPATAATLPVAAPPAPVEAQPEEISAETLSILAAAVAAYLGKRARIRGARLLRTGPYSSPWAQQGRVYIQASHVLQRQ
ncbi:MAG TPA: hypothetical protein VN442_03415 [Bryobacteraceae bacterium]|nr:hypothetical protein [Bryobacteraceae bacterium]